MKNFILLAASMLLVIAAGHWLSGPRYGDASSHREAPLISKDPTADNTDVYAFVSPDNPSTVTLIANYIPLQEPAGGPNFFTFDDNALYEIKIDNDGDAVEDITYRFSFQTQIQNPNTFLYNTGPITSLNDPTYNIPQIYDLTRIDDQGTRVLGTGLTVPPVNIGPASTPNYDQLAEQAIYDLPSGGKVFAGQRDDPFYVDLGAVFDLLTIRPGPPGNSGGGVDGLGGFNVHTVALQVPIDQLTADGQPLTGADDPDAIIGVWATTSRPNTRIINTDGTRAYQGDLVQISRLGLPLVNEVVIPLAQKDLFNGSEPKDDVQFAGFVLDPEPARLLNLLFGLSVPPPPRTDLLALLTGFDGLNKPMNAAGGVVVPSDVQRLNMGIAPRQPGDPGFSTFGVLGGDLSGFPNGRRLQDDVVDIELRVLAGVLVSGFDVAPNNQLGDGVTTNDVPFLSSFPYLGTPHQGFEHVHHPVSAPSGDRVPPECELVERVGSRLTIRTQDFQSGLQEIAVLRSENATVTPEEFDLGTNEPVFVLAEKIDQSAIAVVRLRVTDVAGNQTVCDPVLTTLTAEVPESYLLEQNYPNPFNPTTTIRFQVAEKAHVDLSVYDVTGRKIATLIDQDMEPGIYAAEWDGTSDAGLVVAGGMYLYRLTAGSFTDTKATTLLK